VALSRSAGRRLAHDPELWKHTTTGAAAAASMAARSNAHACPPMNEPAGLNVFADM
jgi:hypothetical protein